MEKRIDFLDLVIEYKREYEALPWYKFRKRRTAKRNWHTARESMARLGLRKMEADRLREIIKDCYKK
tara:strand:- start:72036 stop:72236 length:201 start_codon:yes stop_codon:yes gene_type:complete